MKKVLTLLLAAIIGLPLFAGQDRKKAQKLKKATAKEQKVVARKKQRVDERLQQKRLAEENAEKERKIKEKQQEIVEYLANYQQRRVQRYAAQQELEKQRRKQPAKIQEPKSKKILSDTVVSRLSPFDEYKQLCVELASDQDLAGRVEFMIGLVSDLERLKNSFLEKYAPESKTLLFDKITIKHELEALLDNHLSGNLSSPFSFYREKYFKFLALQAQISAYEKSSYPCPEAQQLSEIFAEGRYDNLLHEVAGLLLQQEPIVGERYMQLLAKKGIEEASESHRSWYKPAAITTSLIAGIALLYGGLKWYQKRRIVSVLDAHNLKIDQLTPFQRDILAAAVIASSGIPGAFGWLKRIVAHEDIGSSALAADTMWQLMAELYYRKKVNRQKLALFKKKFS